MGVVFSQLQTPLLYAPLTKAENELRKTLMWEIETILEKVKLKKQYRDQKRKKFDLEWSFLLGHTCNALGATSFEAPHNFKQGRGVNLTPVEDRNLPKWKKQLWALSKELITMVDEDFAAGEYVVNYACMTQPEHFVKKHVDSHDISHQYAMALGDYSGAYLRCYDEEDNVLGDFDYQYEVCKMDGRLPHELISDDFEGTRFCVVWFKLYDQRKMAPDPIFNTPYIM